jgi:hypothetical protein
MELTFDDQKMQFYPSFNAIYELLTTIVEKITVSLPEVIRTYFSLLKKSKIKIFTLTKRFRLWKDIWMEWTNFLILQWLIISSKTLLNAWKLVSIIIWLTLKNIWKLIVSLASESFLVNLNNKSCLILVEKYSYLANGEAENKISEFIASNKTFDEYCQVTSQPFFKNSKYYSK